MIAKEMGYDDETVEKYYRIGLLHDVGKVGIPNSVLNKPGKLTDEEYDIIKSHTLKGYEVLKDISIVPELAVGALAHHERHDGKGYPNGLSGDEIPQVARIIAVADSFDAMYSDRCLIRLLYCLQMYLWSCTSSFFRLVFGLSFRLNG